MFYGLSRRKVLRITKKKKQKREKALIDVSFNVIVYRYGPESTNCHKNKSITP